MVVAVMVAVLAAANLELAVKYTVTVVVSLLPRRSEL